MDHVDSAPERAQAFLAKEPVLWLGTVRADGHPHLVPTWFVWDGRKILSFSKPHAVKVRAVAADPRVMIALGSPLDDFDVQLIEGEARLLDRPTDHTLAAPIARKYRTWLASAGLTLDGFVETYAQPIEITPVRYLGWQGRAARAAACGASRLSSGASRISSGASRLSAFASRRRGSHAPHWLRGLPSRHHPGARPIRRGRDPRWAFGSGRGPAAAAT